MTDLSIFERTMSKEEVNNKFSAQDARLRWPSFLGEEDNGSASCVLQHSHFSYDEARMLMDADNPEETGNSRQIIEVKILLKKCRIIQKLMISKASEPIYSLDTNFQSQQENSDEQTENHVKKNQRQVCVVWMPQNTNSDLIQLGRLDESLCQQNYSYPRLKQDESLAFIHKVGMDDLLNRRWQKITKDEKMDFIRLRNKLQKLRRYITQQESKKKNEHRCRLCRMQFVNGRQLGGHMSRKHPGSSSDYANKRMMQMIKKLEKNRRNFFKQKRQ